MKKLISIAMAGMLLFSAAGCSTKTAPKENPSSEASSSNAPSQDNGGKKKVAVILPNATHGFLGESIKQAEKASKEFSEKYGVEYQFMTSGESSEQNNQVDTVVNDKVDAIVLWPHNGDELKSAALKAQEAGIPIIVYDRLIPDFSPTSEVEGDNTGIGEMTAAYFNDYFKSDLSAGNKVTILEFKGDNSTVPQERSDGFASKANPNIVIAQQFSTDWQRQKAMEQFETYLNTSSKEDIEKLQGIFTHDDEVVLGVLDAIENYKGEAKLNIKLISGVGGRVENLDTFKPVKEKFGIDQVTYEFSPTMVRKAVETGMKAATGESVEKVVLIPTVEIDNNSEQSYRESEVFKIRYAN